MNDIKVCLATNWWQLWLHWRQWQIRRVPEAVHWRWSWWLYSVWLWDNTLRTVLAAVQHSTPTLEAGGNTLHSPGSPFMPDESDHISTVTDHIDTATGCIGTQTTERLLQQINPYHSLCNHGHTLSVLRLFLPPQKSNRHSYFKPCQVPTVFPLINFSCRGSFFFGQSSKHQTCFVHTRRLRTMWWTSHNTDEFPHVNLCTACKNCPMKLRKPIFTCHNLACKPPQNACMHATQDHFQTVRFRGNSGQTESGLNGRHNHGWSAQHQQLKVI